MYIRAAGSLGALGGVGALGAVLLLLVQSVSVRAFVLTLDAHAEECFFDRVTPNTTLSLTFEVTEGGFLDIDVKVYSLLPLLLAHLLLVPSSM